jgi:thioredoxin-like negative regulator of GroEL
VILNRFATADKEEREKLRRHLLELFAVSPPDAPELAQARKTLAGLLY